MAFIGGTCVLASVPFTAKSLRQQVQAGKATAAEVSRRLRVLMVVGLGEIIIGSGLIVGRALHLYG
jgi:hypothetical protein